eukprot:CCRYP_001528-RI/>CCRYP_001528-RI protein AED:0.17 eAED:0.17 QI:55/0.6/0.5/1/0.8/0.66/6/238/512
MIIGKTPSIRSDPSHHIHTNNNLQHPTTTHTLKPPIMKILLIPTLLVTTLAFTPTPPRTALRLTPTCSTASPFRRRTYGRTSLAMADESKGSVANVGGGTASISNEIFNLVKSIVGAGVLSLPAGIATFGNAPTAIIPAVSLITIIGFFSAYGFSLIGRVCSYTGGKSYREAWSESVGEESSWIPAATCTMKTCCAVLSYSMILADTIRALFMTATGMEVTRTVALLGITSTTLLPLCLLKNLSSLAPFSLVGVAGMFYTAVAMAIRYFQGVYKLAGKFLVDVAKNYQPQFGELGASAALSPNVFILICMLSTAYMAHFNAPKFYNELKNNTIKRYNTVVGTSFGISVLLFALVGSLGFLTFGSASSGLILNNYSTKDILMSLSRVAVAVSIVFSFPLAFVGARDGWLDLLKVPSEKRSNALLNKATFAILSVITLIATQLKELAFIMSFAGATLGNALIYIYPALMFKSAVKKMGEKASKGLRREVPFALFSALLGLVMGSIGTKMALGML